MTLVAVLVVAALAVFVVASAAHFGHLARVWHGVVGHPPEARWVGDYTAGCSLGPKACGAVWDGEDPR